MANKFLNGINVTGTTTLNTVANAGTDTDKFLVLDASGNVDFRTGDELYADLGIGSLPAGFTSTVKHAVKAGVALTKGQAVYVTGADGTNMIVGKASNASEATSSKTMGLIETTLSINGIGNVITEGLLTGLDTTGAAAAGDPVWLGTDGNLIYGLTNKPYAPAHLVFIGIVTRRNANNGEIFVKVQNGFELNEIHDVDLKTTSPINGHILGYNGALWVNKTIAGWLGFTPADDSLVVKLAGAQTITGAKSFDSPITVNSGIGFLNGVMPNITSNLYSGIGGNSEGISIITRPVSTNYTNNLYFATSNNSFTFPDATGTIALTSNLSAYVPTSRTLTINDVTYDLTANRSWTIEAGGTSASTRTIQKFTSTSNQTTFTITGGYTVGMVDVWVNGSKLDNAVDFTASNGTTVVLTDALTANQIVEVYKYGSQFIVNNGLRQKTLFTATAGQTSFTVAYSVGLVDVFYNGSKLDDSEFTATNGTSIVLGTACAVNDKVEVIAFSYNVNGFTGIGGSGTTNNLPKFTAAGTIGDSAITDNGTTVTLVSRALSGTSATFTQSSATSVNVNSTSTSSYSAFIFNENGTPKSYLEYINSAFSDSTRRNYTEIFNNVGGVSIWTNSIKALDINNSQDATFTSSIAATKFILSLGAQQAELTSASNNDFKLTNSGTFRIVNNANTIALFGITNAGIASFYDKVALNAASTTYGMLNVKQVSSQIYGAINVYSNNGTETFLGIGNNGSEVGFEATYGASGQFTPIVFRTSAAERMRITSGGNVGIGTSSPSQILDVQTAAAIFKLKSTTGTNSVYTNYENNGNLYVGIDSSSGGSFGKANCGVLWLSTANSLVFATSNSEKMRLTSGGSLCINATSPGSNSPYLYNFNGDGSRFNAAFEVGVATPGFTSIAFRNPNGTVGSIAINETTVTYGGTSDYRLKEDLKDFSGLDKVNAIKVYDFKWKASEERNEGVLAHELMSVIPYAVNGEKDDINEDGSIKSQMVDYSKLVPVLVKAIQELKAEIEQLKQK
jgi:hypothetical protein